jgi:alkanesulfonate monooxygenase SsuD/methylene tetrahydromethanopterin reductase-like flavin-dependent oxidoreductase (luciferase family)
LNVIFLGLTSKAAEKEGFDSLWVLERLAWSLKPVTRYLSTTDGSLPTQFENIFDPLELLAFVAERFNSNDIKITIIHDECLILEKN